MVRGDVSMEGAATDAGAAAVNPGGLDAGIAPTPTPPTGTPIRPARDTDLASIVRHRDKAITACFLKHAADISGAPELAYRFHVDTRGRVTLAELVPDTLTPTSLGRCLIEVANATEFGPQKQAITFRIPITVRRK